MQCRPLRWRCACLAFLLLAAGSLGAAELLTPLPGRPPAPGFELHDLDGVRHSIEGHRGKVLIVNFWATWCPPCRDEMPSMQRAWERLAEREVAMLAVNVGEDEETVFAFTANYPVDFPLLLDRTSAVIGAWPVRGLPTTFVVDRQGRLAYRAIGGRAWDDPAILAAVEELLAE